MQMETVLDQVCANCGSARLPYGRYCLFCGDVLTEPAEQAQPTGQAEAAQPVKPLSQPRTPPPPAAVQYAGFWRRTWAGAIDLLLAARAARGTTRLIHN